MPRLDADRRDRAHRIEDLAASDRQPRRAEQAAEVKKVLLDVPAEDRLAHGASILISRRMAATSLPRTFSMSSWYLRTTPRVGSIASGESTF